MFSNFASLLAVAPTIDLSGIDLSAITDSIVSLTPIVLVPVISLLAIRKGISFVQSMLRGA